MQPIHRLDQPTSSRTSIHFVVTSAVTFYTPAMIRTKCHRTSAVIHQCLETKHSGIFDPSHDELTSNVRFPDEGTGWFMGSRSTANFRT